MTRLQAAGALPRGPWALLAARGPAGAMLRVLAPAVALIVIGAGWLRLLGQRAGWYGTETGIALLVTVVIVLLWATLYATARSLHTEHAARERAEGELAETAEFGRQVIAGAGEGIIVFDKDLRYRLVNPQMELIANVTEAALLGRHPTEAFPELVAQGLVERLEQGLAGELVQVPDMAVETPAGTQWTSGRVVPLRGAGGDSQGVIVTVRDVTERHRNEEALRHSEARYRMLAEAVSDAIVISEDGVLRDVNRGFEQLFGYTAEEVVGRSVLVLVDPLWHAVVAARVESGNEEPYELVGIAKNGRRLELQSVSRMHRNERTMRITALRDLTATRTAERQLRLQGSALDAAANAIVIVDRDGTIQWVNAAWEALTGYTPEESVGRTPRMLKSGQQDDAFYASMWRTVLAGKVWRGELVNRRRDGSLYTEEQTITPVLDHAGAVRHFIAVKEDITARKDAELRLRESRERLRLAVSAGRVGLWEWDLRTNTVHYSGEWKAQIGHGEHEIGDSIEEWRSRVHPDDVKRVLLSIRRFLRGSDTHFESQFRLRHKDGSYRHVLARASSVRNGGDRRTRVLGASIDITDHMQLQAQLLQAQKMESVGRLAGGIAHDFNNLLTVIIGTAELLLADRPGDDPVHPDLVEIHRTAGRAAALTRQLLAFSRRQVLQPDVLDINAVIGDLWPMMGRLVGADLAMLFTPGDALGRVRADPAQIQQVLLNLVVNARDAMPNGGTLSVATRNIELDAAGTAGSPTMAPGRHVEIEVTDTGAGMSAAVLARIFEPFFTTKELGRGTGLGLSTVYGIVKQSGGGIRVASQPGRGTTFRILLPRVDAAMPEARTVTAESRAVRGTETVLVVEDEDGLRRVVARVLARAGYTVLTAESGPAALALLADRPGGVHLVLTDVVMPGMNGPELAREISARFPGIRIIFTSGYVDDRTLREKGLPEGVGFLAKPYTVADLTTKIREALG